MDTAIACDSAALTQNIRSALQHIGYDCPPSRVISLESADAFIDTVRNGDSFTTLFFGSSSFSPSDLALLRRLCATTGDRLKIVAIGPSFGSDVVLQVIRCGAADYIDVSNKCDAELNEVLERLRSCAGDLNRSSQLFTIVSPAGGSGASVLAVNLAVAIARTNHTCGLLDFQLRGGTLAALLKLQPRHTLLSLAEKAQHLDRSMFEQSVMRHETGVCLLAGPEQFAHYRNITSQITQQVIHWARALYPTVIVDLEDCEHPEQVRALVGSTKVIVPFRLEFISLVQTKKLLDHLHTLGIALSNILLVANRVGQPKDLPIERAEEVLTTPIVHRIIDDPATVNASCNLGTPFVLSTPKSRVSIAITRLAETLTCGVPLTTAPGWKPTLARFVLPAARLVSILPFLRCKDLPSTS